MFVGGLIPCVPATAFKALLTLWFNKATCVFTTDCNCLCAATLILSTTIPPTLAAFFLAASLSFCKEFFSSLGG